jgi:TatA/E family protein of Tat protein translocase
MFNLGPFELVAIFIVALLVFGPEKLPEMGKQVGRAVREFKKFQDSMQSNVRDVLEPIAGPIIPNGPVGPAATNIRGGNIPQSATIQNPEPAEGEATPPGGAGETAAPAAGPGPAGEAPPPHSSAEPDTR